MLWLFNGSTCACSCCTYIIMYYQLPIIVHPCVIVGQWRFHTNVNVDMFLPALNFYCIPVWHFIPDKVWTSNIIELYEINRKNNGNTVRLNMYEILRALHLKFWCQSRSNLEQVHFYSKLAIPTTICIELIYTVVLSGMEIWGLCTWLFTITNDEMWLSGLHSHNLSVVCHFNIRLLYLEN